MRIALALFIVFVICMPVLVCVVDWFIEILNKYEPELPFKPGDEVRLVNQADADMDGRRAVVERAYRNSRTSKIDVEIRFDDEQNATYMYNDTDLVKEE